VESRIASRASGIGADELTVFYADAAVIYEVEHGPEAFDLIVRAASRACFPKLAWP